MCIEFIKLLRQIEVLVSISVAVLNSSLINDRNVWKKDGQVWKEVEQERAIGNSDSLVDESSDVE